MDPISDMFIRIKNAYRAGHESVQIPYSKFRQEIVKALERAGFVGKLERKGKRVRKVLDVTLKYHKDEPALHGVRFISKPSRRLYVAHRGLRPARRGGAVFITTSKGLLTSEEAKKEKVGGEMIAEVW